MRAANLSNAVPENINMQDCDLSNANLLGARFKNVDLRGATLKNIETKPIYVNTIMSDGTIMNFPMGSSADNFSICYYADINENVVSAKISDDDAKIWGGAKLTIERSVWSNI